MPERTASAAWEGPVKEGHGTIMLESGRMSAPYSFGARFGAEPGTNPEELLGGAVAGCFTMALSLALTEAGHPPTRIDTTARVAIVATDGGFAIPRVQLRTNATVPGLDEPAFQEHAERARAGCPVSKALAGTEISLEAHLVT